MAIELPRVFIAGASLSGDYDQFKFPNDNLYNGFFGRLKANEDRWKGRENPAKLIGGLQVPFYVGHGLKDAVVPHSHTESLKEHVEFYKVTEMVKFHTDSTAGHSYSYWNSELENVIDFFKTAR